MTRTAGQRTGLLGGSFDPVHVVHLDLARTARAHLQLDTVQLIPAAAPWQRAPLGASPEDRLAMLALAVAGEPGLTVNAAEIARSGPTYTVDTLRAMSAGDDPAHTYVWLLGSDQLANFCTWHAWEEIASRVQLAVASRPGFAPAPPEALSRLLEARATPVAHLPWSPSPVSATEIRARAKAGLSLDGLTPAAVADYIRTHHLYQT